MNVLFDIGHPAHVHLFRNFINYLKSKEVNVCVTSRDKEITNILLAHYNIPYVSLSKPKKGLAGMFLELITRDYKIWKLNKQQNFSYAFGTSVSIGHLTFLSNVTSFNFNEDDDDVVPLYTYLSYPFCTEIICPNCIRFSKWKAKRILHSSYHELAYLHPNNFKPNEEVLKKYGLEKGRFVIFRLVSLNAHHDVGAKGISPELKEKMQLLLSGYNIIESFEGKDGNKVEPWDMHHLLAFAKMIISDSQTMTIEAAVLGVPAMRINTFIGKSTVIDELEHKYQLAFGMFPQEEEKILKTLQMLIGNADLEKEWTEKRNKLLSEKVDLNQWMIDYFEQKIKSLK